MSATMSEASHSASGATDCRVMVQLALRERGVETMSNCTLRHSGWRSSARATRHLISSSVAAVLVSKSMSHPHRWTLFGAAGAVNADSLDMIFAAGMVNGALRLKKPVKQPPERKLFRRKEFRPHYPPFLRERAEIGRW